MNFPNEASEFIYTRTYSKWIEEKQRRETWPETVERYIEYIQYRVKKLDTAIPVKTIKKIREYMLSFGCMPSMRMLWSAGPAMEQSDVCAYNCSFMVIDSVESFSELLYILCCGTGVGFSVERKYTDKLPEVPHMSSEGSGTHIIDDSKEGWADSVKLLMISLYAGRDLDMDYSKLRGKGARLKTFGGRSSGPAPLMHLHEFIRRTFNKAQGRKLKPIECHDIANKIGEVVVVGGVRRSAQVSLSDLDDDLLRDAKMWPFPIYRSIANNSATYYNKPTATEFLFEWASLAKSGTGERGIFNLEGARKRCPERRKSHLIQGSNPCLEILLRNKGFCNLTEVVIRNEDDLDSLLDKVECATWMGCIQACMTNFKYIGGQWTKNANEERLLGVSLSGQMDNPEIINPETLKALKSRVLKIAKKASKTLGINMPAATTCVKPSGTVSQLCNSSSGVHARFSKYYIRRYRIASIDPLFKLLKNQNVPMTPDNGQREKDWAKAKNGDLGSCPIYEKGKRWSEDKVNTWVVSFPIKSPESSITTDQKNAIEQLEYIKMLQVYWAEHSVSATVFVKDEEWLEVGNWVYKNWEYINGVSFLPFDGGKYEQAPYEQITEEQYIKLSEELPKIDYSELSRFETEDNTTGSKEIACGGGMCEL